ncbi:MAG: T9SS type A sorting domain-containing protein [Chitinophagaceae bacterium]|nr:T9SS type A sorting domain-containing protein [Chitinophagaceae bacterium]
MKKILLNLVFLLNSAWLLAQAIPATETDFNIDKIVPPSLGVAYNTASDFRAGVPNYNNFHYASATDYLSTANSKPFVYWETSHGTSGFLGLPADARDPDVVFLNNNTETYLMCVYYKSTSIGGATGYYYRASLYDPILHTYLPGGGLSGVIELCTNPNPCINIDADNKGNFGIIWKRTATLTRTIRGNANSVPTFLLGVPSTITVINNFIEPDIAVANDSGIPRYIYTAVNTSRTNLRKVSANTLFSAFSLDVSISSSLIFNPRIACPAQGNINQYSIIYSRNFTVSGTPFQNIELRYSTASGLPPLTVLNNSTFSAAPAINAGTNSMPVLTYGYDGSGNEYLSTLWYCDFPANNIQRQIIGVDISTMPFLPLSYYVAASTSHSNTAPFVYETPSVSVAGRYTEWGKACSFLNDYDATNYIYKWKYQNWGIANWRPSGDENQTVTDKNENQISIFPNPTNSSFSIKGNCEHEFSVNILDVKGTVLFKSNGTLQDINDKLNSYNSLANGLYLINIKDQTTGETKIEKLMKN